MTKPSDGTPKLDTGRGLDCSKDGRTKQEFGARSDINDIIKRFRKTGMVDSVNRRQAVYADVSQIPDFRTAFNRIQAAQEMFMEFPAEVRKRFGNDPARLLDFCKDPSNREEAIKLGLIPAPVKPVEPMAPVVPPKAA